MNKKRKKFIKEFSENYAELFVSVFILKYLQEFDKKYIIEDMDSCIKLSKELIIDKFAEGIVLTVDDET